MPRDQVNLLFTQLHCNKYHLCRWNQHRDGFGFVSEEKWDTHKFIEYPVLESTHKDQVHLLAPHRNTPKSDPLSESIVQMLFDCYMQVSDRIWDKYYTSPVGLWFIVKCRVAKKKKKKNQFNFLLPVTLWIICLMQTLLVLISISLKGLWGPTLRCLVNSVTWCNLSRWIAVS